MTHDERVAQFSKRHALIPLVAGLCVGLWPSAAAHFGKKGPPSDAAIVWVMPILCSWALAFVLLALSLVLVVCLPWRSYCAGYCKKCGYDLKGHTSGRCPECREPAPHHGSPRATTASKSA